MSVTASTNISTLTQIGFAFMAIGGVVVISSVAVPAFFNNHLTALIATASTGLGIMIVSGCCTAGCSIREAFLKHERAFKQKVSDLFPL